MLTSANRDDVPAFDDVAIDPNGTLTIRNGRRGERGPVAAGRALHALLATADVPVALRLFVTQANGSETHASLAAFAKGLAYFGKSDRAELIRAIYARYKPTTATAPVPANAAMSPPASRTPPASRPAQRLISRGTFRRGLVAAAVIVFLASGAVVGWLLITPGARPKSDATQGEKPASKATAPSAKHAADSRPPSVTATKAHTPERPVSEARTVQPSAPARSHATLSKPESTPVPAPAAVLRSDADQAPLSPRTELARALSRIGEPARAAGPPLTNAAIREHAVAGTSAAIYSNDDVDVQPPVMLYPQLPPVLMVGSPSEGLVNRMELVVAPDGCVERVSLVGGPRRMADKMHQSGAEMWKFKPAVKDGVPVRYRTLVSWTVFP